KTAWWLLTKLNMVSPYDPAIQLMGIYHPKNGRRDSVRYLYTCVHSTIHHNGQKVEAIQMPSNEQIDKQNVAIEYYSSLKRKEFLTCATPCMNLEAIMPSEISQSQK
ncbi:LORF2 protein, partial [Crocuta crocuta]